MTTALQLFTNEKFDDIRVLLIDGEPWFVGKDVANNLGYANPRDALANHVPDKYKRDGVAIRDSIGREQFPTLINEAGLYKLVFASKSPRAVEFSDWVCEEVIPNIRKTGSYSIQPQIQMTPLDAVNQVIEISTKIQDFYATHKGIATTQAIALVEPVYGKSLNPLRQLIPPAEHETGFLNATQIGQMLGFKPRQTNLLIAEEGFIYKVNGVWRLTEAGKAYGEEIPFTRNGHSGYQIRWNASFVDVLKERRGMA